MKKKKIKILTSLSFIFLVFILGALHKNTGFFERYSGLDSRDLDYWERENGVIKRAEGFSLLGNKQNCWILLHSYTATPKEMKSLSERINKEFGDSVFVPRISGHGTVPSELLGKNLEVWYEEVKQIFNEKKDECKNLHILGSSLSSSLVLRLGKEEAVKSVYLVNPFLYLDYKWYRGLPSRAYIKLFGNIFVYNKKAEVAQINDPDGRKEHLAYWNMPYKPVNESFGFIDDTIRMLDDVKTPILVQYSINDRTAGERTVSVLQSKLASSNKKFISYSHSNHVLLSDFDRENVEKSIIDFARDLR